jgi:hypothetical protein
MAAPTNSNPFVFGLTSQGFVAGPTQSWESKYTQVYDKLLEEEKQKEKIQIQLDALKEKFLVVIRAQQEQSPQEFELAAEGAAELRILKLIELDSQGLKPLDRAVSKIVRKAIDTARTQLLETNEIVVSQQVEKRLHQAQESNRPIAQPKRRLQKRDHERAKNTATTGTMTDTIEDRNERIDKLLVELKEANAKEARATANFDALQVQIATHDGLIADEKKKTEEVQNKLDAAKEQERLDKLYIADIEERLVTEQENVKERNETINRLEAENRRLQSQNQLLDRQQREIRADGTRDNRTLNEMREQLNAANVNGQVLLEENEALKTSSAEIPVLKQKLADAEGITQGLINQLNKLRSEMPQFDLRPDAFDPPEGSDHERTFADELEGFEGGSDRASLPSDDGNEELEELRKDAMEKQAQIDRLENEKQARETDIQGLRDEISRLTAQEDDLERLRREKDTHETDIDRLKREKEAQDAEVQRLQREKEGQDAEVQRLKQEKANQNAEVQRLQREKESRDAEVQRLEQEKANQEAGFQHLRDQENAQAAEIVRLQAEAAARSRPQARRPVDAPEQDYVIVASDMGYVPYEISNHNPFSCWFSTEANAIALVVSDLAHARSAAAGVGCSIVGYFRKRVAPSPINPPQDNSQAVVMMSLAGSKTSRRCAQNQARGLKTGGLDLASLIPPLEKEPDSRVPFARGDDATNDTNHSQRHFMMMATAGPDGGINLNDIPDLPDNPDDHRQPLPQGDANRPTGLFPAQISGGGSPPPPSPSTNEKIFRNISHPNQPTSELPDRFKTYLSLFIHLLFYMAAYLVYCAWRHGDPWLKANEHSRSIISNIMDYKYGGYGQSIFHWYMDESWAAWWDRVIYLVFNWLGATIDTYPMAG